VRDFYFWRGRNNSPSSISPFRWQTFTLNTDHFSMALFFRTSDILYIYYIYSWDAMCWLRIYSKGYTNISYVLSSKRNLFNQMYLTQMYLTGVSREHVAIHLRVTRLFWHFLLLPRNLVAPNISWITPRIKLWQSVPFHAWCIFSKTLRVHLILKSKIILKDWKLSHPLSRFFY